jgi:hypothetical protein
MRLAALAAVGLGVLVCFNACGSSDGKKANRDEAGAGGDDSGTPGGSSGNADAGTPGGGNAGSADGGSSASAGDGNGGSDGSTAGTGGTDGSTAGAGGADDNPPVIGPVSVDGIVVARNEQPVPNITVEIQGQSIVTGADGRFQLDAIAPYDIVVRGEPLGGDTYIEAYLGVTRSNPKLYRSFVEEDRAGGASGTISGGVGFPQPTGHETRVMFGGPVLATFMNSLIPGSDGTYDSSGDPTWLNTGMLSGRLFAIQVATATQTVTGIGSAPFTLIDAQTTPGGDVAMTTPTFHDFTLNLSSPSGLTITQASVVVSGFPQARNTPGAQEVFSIPSGVPDEIGVSVSVYASGPGLSTAGALYTLPGNATSLDVELLAPPNITGPAQPQLMATTPISYTRPNGTVATLNFSYEIGDAEVNYGTFITVYTDQSSITLKRLDDLSIDIPAGDFACSAGALGAAPNVDELLGPNNDRWPLGTSSSSPQIQLIHGVIGPLP